MFDRLWADLFLILNVGDCFSTNLALNRGALEANLLYGFLAPELGAGLWAIKVALAIGLVSVVRNHVPQWFSMFRVLCAALSLVVINNVVLAIVLNL